MAQIWVVVSDSALARIVLVDHGTPARELARLKAKDKPSEFAADIASLLARAKAAGRFSEIALVMPSHMLRAVRSALGPARHDITVEIESGMVLESAPAIARAVSERLELRKAKAS